MIKDSYVSFEVAKLLKEKGFAEPLVNYYYTTKGYFQNDPKELCNFFYEYKKRFNRG